MKVTPFCTHSACALEIDVGKAKALLTLALLNLAKVDDLGAVETALKNATEAPLGERCLETSGLV